MHSAYAVEARFDMHLSLTPSDFGPGVEEMPTGPRTGPTQRICNRAVNFAIYSSMKDSYSCEHPSRPDAGDSGRFRESSDNLRARSLLFKEDRGSNCQEPFVPHN
jgi:hypothetical protein